MTKTDLEKIVRRALLLGAFIALTLSLVLLSKRGLDSSLAISTGAHRQMDILVLLAITLACIGLFLLFVKYATPKIVDFLARKYGL